MLERFDDLEGQPVHDPGGEEIGRVVGLVQGGGAPPIEIRVALEQHVLGVEEAADASLLLRVPTDDLGRDERGRLVLRRPYEVYRGPPGTLP